MGLVEIRSLKKGNMDKVKSFGIEKFDGGHFQLWKYQMEIIFRVEKLLHVVDGTLARPDVDSRVQ